MRISDCSSDVCSSDLLLDIAANEGSFRELAGLAGQKPWECVGEILEAAACLYTLTRHADWPEAAAVRAVKADLLAQYGEPKLPLAMADCLTRKDERTAGEECGRQGRVRWEAGT